MLEVRYPEVVVDLSEQNGDALAIMSAVIYELRNNGAPPKDIAEYAMDSLSGDYSHALQTVLKWVTVC